MIITEVKPFQEIIDSLRGFTAIFLIGCGECATTCKTGGEAEVLQLKAMLEAQGKVVHGMCIPGSPCVASQLKAELAKHMKSLRQTEVIVVLACGLGAQSVKDNDRLGLVVVPACNTLFSAVMDAQGVFVEKCSLCGDCVLESTAGVCPITLCAKGLLNGPCGGMDKGKCEVDKEKDCAWVLIYKELEKRKKLEAFKKVHPAKSYRKAVKPRKLILEK